METPVDGGLTVETPISFGSRLSMARRAVGLTQEQLGQGLAPDGGDLGKGAISSWEVDRTQPTAGQIATLCQRLKVSADHLLGLDAAHS